MKSEHPRVEIYFHDLLQTIYSAMLAAQIPMREIVTTSSHAFETARVRYRSNAPEDPLVSEAIASVLHAWHHNRAYTDAHGCPKALHRANTRPSLVHLIKHEDGRVPPDEVIAAMIRLRLIRRTRDGKLRPVGRIATVRTLDPVLAEHVCQSLSRMLVTVNRNTCESEIETRLIERSAQVQDLPKQKLREFREFVNSQGEIFINSMNDWLESRRSRSSSVARSRITRAGIHIFAFAEPIQVSRR